MTSEALMRFLDEHGFEGYTFTTPDVLAIVQPSSHIEEALELFVDRLISYDPAELSMMVKTKVADLMANTIETYEVQENTLTPEQSEQLLADFADIFVHVRTQAVCDYEVMIEEAVAIATEPPEIVTWESTYRDRMNASIPKMLQHDRFHITSFHYADVYDITVVLAKFESSWGTWIYNLDRDNFSHGHYFPDYQTAVTDYARRVLMYAGNRTAVITEIPNEDKG